MKNRPTLSFLIAPMGSLLGMIIALLFFGGSHPSFAVLIGFLIGSIVGLCISLFLYCLLKNFN